MAKLESGGGTIGVPHENEAGSDGRGKWCSLGKNKTPDDTEYVEQSKSTNVSRAKMVLADIAGADATIGGVRCIDHENHHLSRAGAHNFTKRFLYNAKQDISTNKPSDECGMAMNTHTGVTPAKKLTFMR